MKGKIIKGIMSVLLVCSISVPMSGCALVNPDVRENFEEWADDFLGGFFGDNDDEDDKKDPSTDDGNEGGENGNENTGTENEGGVVNTKFEGNGIVIRDLENNILIRPSKTTAHQFETVPINVTDLGGDRLKYSVEFSVLDSESTAELEVTSDGYVYTKTEGVGYILVKVIDVAEYIVEFTVNSEIVDETTYVLSSENYVDEKVIKISHYEVKMRKGESFTVSVETPTTGTPTNLSVLEINGGVGYTLPINIEGLTVTATLSGECMLLVRYDDDGSHAFPIYVTIIE